MLYTQHKNKYFILPLFASFVVLSGCASNSEYAEPKMVEKAEPVAINQSVISPSKIFMRRKTEVDLIPHEELEERIRRIANQTVEEQKPIFKQMADQTVAANEENFRQIAQQTVADSGEYIKDIAYQTLEENEQLIGRVAQRTVEENETRIKAIATQIVKDSGGYIQGIANQNLLENEQFIRKLAQQTVVNSDSELQEAIKKVVNSTVIEAGKPIEYTVQRIIKETFADVEVDPIQKAIRKVADETIADNKENFRKLAQETIKENEPTFKQIAQNTVEENTGSFKQIAEEVVEAKKDQFKMIAQSTFVENESRIREVAVEEIGKASPDEVVIREMVNEIVAGKGLEDPGIVEDDMAHINLEASKFGGSTNAGDWIDLKEYYVVVHEDNTKLQDIIMGVMRKARPFVGPWKIKWKLRQENLGLMEERFSLDAETNFEAFSTYLSSYMASYSGYPLKFEIYQADRILVIAD